MGKYSHLPQLQSSQSYVGIKTAPNYLFYPHIYYTNSNSPFAEYVSLQEKNNSKRCWSVRGFKLECFSFPIYLLANVQVARNSAFYESLMHNLSSGCFPMHKCRQYFKTTLVNMLLDSHTVVKLGRKKFIISSFLKVHVVGKRGNSKIALIFTKVSNGRCKNLEGISKQTEKVQFFHSNTI